MGHFLTHVFEPGLLSSGPVRVAALVGAVIAVAAGVIGVFTVTRGQSFAGHSLADVATTGGSGAFLVGLNQFWGFLAFGIGAAAFLEAIGVQRRRGRDVATGVMLGAALGVAALFLYLGTQTSSTTGASLTILFGSLFVISSSTVPALVASGLIALAGVIALSLGIVLAYDSYYWPPHGHGWPVSFFVVALVVVFYLLTYLRQPARRTPGQTGERACSPA